MLLGIDVGTTHTKVGVYALDGSVLSHAKALTPREEDEHGRDLYPPDTLWETVAALLREVTKGHRVEALSVSSMGEAGVPVDAGGEPTFPIIPWNDLRASEQLQWFEAHLSAERCFAITGLFPSAIHSVIKWMWLAGHAPDAWKRTETWLSACNYISFRLTGERVMEASQAARTLAYDVRSGEWSREVLDAAGLDGSFLPPVVGATKRVGGVSREAVAKTGLREGTPVFGGGARPHLRGLCVWHASARGGA